MSDVAASQRMTAPQYTAFARHDRNGDGRLTMQDIAHRPDHRDAFIKMLRLGDKNQDFALDKHEFVDLFNRADTNHDGKVNDQESDRLLQE